MFYLVTIALMLHLPFIINGIDVKIDGLIDLGSNWNYKYQIQPFAEDFDALSKSDSYADPQLFRGNRRKRKRKNDRQGPHSTPANFNLLKELIVNAAPLLNHGMTEPKIVDINENEFPFINNDYFKKADDSTDESDERYPKGVTRFNSNKNYTKIELYGRERKVKHDDVIRGFIEQVYKKSLRAFDTIKDKVSDGRLRKKIDSLASNYADKFIEFSNSTQKQFIKTKLGAQKVILNTIDTSNTILSRLANYLTGEVNKKGALRESISAAHMLQREVKKETESQYHEACHKFGICRSTDSFSRFLVEVSTNLLLQKDHKIKQAFDALTEVLKNNDFSNVMDTKTEKRYNKLIDHFERMPPSMIRPGLLILKNTIAHKNKPITVNGRTDSRVNKTIAFLSLIDTLDTKLPSNEANRLEWNDIKNSLDQWSQGRRQDIEDIMQTFIVHLKKGIDSMQTSSAENTMYNMRVLLLK